jgi:hypothetical protein
MEKSAWLPGKIFQVQAGNLHPIVSRMNPIREARLKLRRELEAPPALRRFGSG